MWWTLAVIIASGLPPHCRDRGAAGTNPGEDLLPERLRTGRDREVLGPGEHPFPTKYAVRTSQLAIEPSIYLETLMRDFVLFGGKIVIRKFDTPRDLMSLTESVIVNCTGLGSKTLFNDDELVPVKGQLTVCIPQPEVSYRASGRLPNSAVIPPSWDDRRCTTGSLAKDEGVLGEAEERALASALSFHTTRNVDLVQLAKIQVGLRDVSRMNGGSRPVVDGVEWMRKICCRGKTGRWKSEGLYVPVP